LSRGGKPTQAQRDALRQLRKIAGSGTPLTAVTLVGVRAGSMQVQLTLATGTITQRAPGGVPIGHESENVLLTFTPAYPWAPPIVHVEHGRFVGHPHVLQGQRLCLYLDVGQEWHPAQGVVGVLERLWQWLNDAAAARFDARLALFHPVGGVLHQHPGAPTVVVREPLPTTRPFARAWLVPRTLSRLDLIPHAAPNATVALVVYPAGPLWFGAGTTVEGLCAALQRAVSPTPQAFLAVLAATALRNAPCTPVHFVLSVPASDRRSDAPGHLLAGRLPPTVAEALRRQARAAGPLVIVNPSALADVEIEWCPVSEERQTQTTRRDEHRPVEGFRGAHVALWGCGGIGSWMGEFLARAGAAHLTLCDPFPVTGGLLVRQDYTELDIGTDKAEALATRLRSLRDDLAVDVIADPFAVLAAARSLPDCDLLIDATVNNAVAAALSTVWTAGTNKPLVARVATDRASSTLGLMTVTRPGYGPDPATVDDHLGRHVDAAGDLEPFRCLWTPPEASDELVPAPGCSVPTFHGSAADLAAVAGTLTSLLGPHLHQQELIAGGHLFALPHTPTGATGRRWLPADPPDDSPPPLG
jgi:hypothetical protein